MLTTGDGASSAERAVSDALATVQSSSPSCECPAHGCNRASNRRCESLFLFMRTKETMCGANFTCVTADLSACLCARVLCSYHVRVPPYMLLFYFVVSVPLVVSYGVEWRLPSGDEAL